MTFPFDDAIDGMDLLPPAGWGAVARRADLDALAATVRGEMAEL
jgi:hypothetical protein